jgi:uncharacterized Zn finger protein (UPF0148 family)
LIRTCKICGKELWDLPSGSINGLCYFCEVRAPEDVLEKIKSEEQKQRVAAPVKKPAKAKEPKKAGKKTTEKQQPKKDRVPVAIVNALKRRLAEGLSPDEAIAEIYKRSKTKEKVKKYEKELHKRALAILAE